MNCSHRAGAALSAALACAAWAPPLQAQEPSPPAETDLDRALREAEANAPAAPAAAPAAPGTLKLGSATLRLIDLSLDTLFAVGTSNQKEDEILVLQGGGHDPRRRGFTVQNVELSLAAAVDPYFSAAAHLIYFLTPEGESAFELEEVFVTSTALPWGFQLEAGQFFTEFGRLNPQHPHQWDFQDQPVIHTRLFGPDGLRGPGVRLSWLAPLPWFAELHLGVQNANGETMASFLASDEFFKEAAVGGRQFVARDVRTAADVLYLGRAVTSVDLGESLTVVLGASALFGPNATGTHAHTEIWGSDLKVKWRPASHFRGWPFVLVQGEVIARRYLAATQDFDPDGSIAAGAGPNGDEFTAGRATLRDHGFYVQALWGFWYGWVVGVRYEHARSTGDSINPTTGLDATDTDPLRDKRTRVALTLAWHPTEYSRIRLQLNHDVATHMRHRFRLHEPETSQSVWLGIEFFFGAHAAHTY